jgi:two-component system heavy metal sensor histidine kinase CusS
VSKSRVGSLGRRLSSWLALQSLAGLAVVCVAVYAVTYVNLAARQLETIAQKETQVLHLLAESTRDGDVGMLKHKLDDFFIGHQDLALSLQRPDGSRLLPACRGRSHPPEARAWSASKCLRRPPHRTS